MTPDQRSRYRRLAEVELERGNALAVILLDALDEMDAEEARSATRAEPTWQERFIAEAQTHPTRPFVEPLPAAFDVVTGPVIPADDPPVTPRVPPSVLAQDLATGPGGEIEVDLGGEPTLEGRAPMRDAPPTTQS